MMLKVQGFQFLQDDGIMVMERFSWEDEIFTLKLITPGGASQDDSLLSPCSSCYNGISCNEGKGESLTWQGLFQGMVLPLEEPEGLQVGEGILVGSQDEEGPLLDFPSTRQSFPKGSPMPIYALAVRGAPLSREAVKNYAPLKYLS
ncbi:hypothetical protein DY000_02022959 [Brassica cretica]|uniref:Uncharacterized protein n=1 Tax=Brassica cretica TaxID=69181 RepID=A0ABQ7E4U3_BRACR|nr:hypothetical protein DY000_02022959 [Brassica cretica]